MITIDCAHPMVHFAPDRLGWLCITCGAYILQDDKVRRHPLYVTEKASHATVREALRMQKRDCGTPPPDMGVLCLQAKRVNVAWVEFQRYETEIARVKVTQALFALVSLVRKYEEAFSQSPSIDFEGVAESP